MWRTSVTASDGGVPQLVGRAHEHLDDLPVSA
jgi:hypothetical protein